MVSSKGVLGRRSSTIDAAVCNEKEPGGGSGRVSLPGRLVWDLKSAGDVLPFTAVKKRPEISFLENDEGKYLGNVFVESVPVIDHMSRKPCPTSALTEATVRATITVRWPISPFRRCFSDLASLNCPR